MNQIWRLINPIQHYAWGSFSAIADLLGHPRPTHKPQAELWLGAHPKAPSKVETADGVVSLAAVIADDPGGMLGEAAARQFDNRLPFLFKVLAAGQPLSLQAHPDKPQARDGYRRENEIGIPLHADHRNFKDDQHKPECICALTPFWGLNGFRPLAGLFRQISRWKLKHFETMCLARSTGSASADLRRMFHRLMTLETADQEDIIAEALENTRRGIDRDPVCRWIHRLHRFYPTDVGILSPLLLNLICLSPGQAMYLSAGTLHAYLEGLGIELMANSDNVLRGGLTHKHVDLDGLMQILRFEEQPLHLLAHVHRRPFEKAYGSPAEEFVLSVIHLPQDGEYTSPRDRSIEILLCTRGKVHVFEQTTAQQLLMNKGSSVVVPAAVDRYRLSGAGDIYKAAVPIQ